jgi:hypothetical protein
MPDNSKPEDTLAPALKKRSATKGDVPDALSRRYYTDERGGDGIGFYVDARIETPAFRDRGAELVAARLDPNAVRDMAVIAEHRGWTIVTARGSAEFRREAWLAGRSIGLEVRGYRPAERDIQELERRTNRRLRASDRLDVRHERREERRDHVADEQEVRRARGRETGAHTQMKLVDAVVRARVTDPERQERILASARSRIADWLERGARFEPLQSQERSSPPQRENRRERQLGR